MNLFNIVQIIDIVSTVQPDICGGLEFTGIPKGSFMNVPLQFWKTGVGMKAGVISVQNHSLSHMCGRVIAMQHELPALSSNVKNVEVIKTAWDL